MQRLDKQAQLQRNTSEQDAQPDATKPEWINFTMWGVGLPKLVLRTSRDFLHARYFGWAYKHVMGCVGGHLIAHMLHMYCRLDDDEDDTGVPEVLMYNPLEPDGECVEV
jgi:hypothetical protein